jgi:hypothetical protein
VLAIRRGGGNRATFKSITQSKLPFVNTQVHSKHHGQGFRSCKDQEEEALSWCSSARSSQVLHELMIREFVRFSGGFTCTQVAS